MVTVMKSLKKFIASMLVVLMMFVQFPFAAIAEEIENANNEEVQTAESSEGTENEENNEGEEGENPEANDDEEPPFQTRGATRGGDEIEYGEGFKIALRWGGTSNPAYTWHADEEENRVIKLTCYYQNEVSPVAYDVGDIRITIPGIGKLNRSSTKKASDIAADVLGAEEIKRDWSYTYDSANDIYTFYNNHAIELGETFNGSFEMLYEFNSRQSVNGFEKTIQATLNDGYATVTSQDLSIEFTSKRDEFYINKTAEGLLSYDGLGRFVPEGKTAANYAWVRYTFTNGTADYNSRALQNKYMTDTFPEGCIIVGASGTTNQDGTITYTGLASSLVVGYPESMIGQTVNNTAYLYGTYYEEEEPVLLDDSTVSITLERIAPYVPGVLISKYISPDYVYKDSITNTLNFSATLRANIKTSSDSSGVYSVAITDDLLEMCSKDKTDSTKNTMKVLDDDEYTFTQIRVPGVSSFTDANGYTLEEGDYDLKLYALYRSDVTEGDLSTRALSNYTKVFDGKWTNSGAQVTFDQDVLAVRAELSGLIENIPSFYIVASGKVKDLADSIETEEYVNPKYIINHEFTEYEDNEGHSLINVGDYTRQDIYDRDVAIYGAGVARTYDTIVFREREVSPSYYYAYADIKPFAMDENGEYFETELSHYTRMNNSDRSEIKSVEVHGVTAKADLETLIESLTLTYSGLTFKDSLPSDVNMDEYLMERASITKDGNEIKIVFDFTDNPIVSTSFELGYKVDARVAYEDYYDDTNPSYTVRTYSYTPDGTMRPNNTATHEGKTMATNSDYANILLALASHQQLIKMVRTTYSGDFVEEDAVTPMNDIYTYRLKLRNGYNTLLNTEFIDVLEHAELTEVDGDYPYSSSEWYGTFQNVDTSYMEDKGFTTRVYYANTLAPDENSWTLMETHQDGVWSTQNTVKAIKVCIDGEIPENSIVYVDVNMLAPYDTTLEDKKAYNTFTVNGDAIDVYSGVRSSYMENMPSNVVDVTLVEKTYDVYISKVDAVNGIKLQGAKFALYDSNNQKIRSDYTGILGNIPFKNLKAGTYTIKEEETPAGYQTISDHTLTINSDGTYTLVSNNQTVSQGNATLENNIPTIRFDIENQRAKGSIKIHKIDEYKNSNKEEIVLPNATIELKDQEGTVVATGTTNAQGEITFNNIDWGKVYTVEEITAPQGYKLAVQNVYLSKSNKDATVVLEDERKEGTATLTKQDEVDETKIEGAKYGLFAKEDIYDKDGEVLYEADTKIEEKLTDNNGQVTFENIIWGEYYIKEIETVYGYELDEQEYPFTISAQTVDTEQQFTVNEERSKANLQLVKITDKGNFLPGAKFKLFNEDGTDAVLREKVMTTEIVFSKVGNFGWKQNDDGTWQSDNYNVSSSTAEIESNEFTLSQTETISFDWSVSSQGTSYDYLYYTITNTETNTVVSGTGTGTKIGGTSYGSTYDSLSYVTINKELQPGKYKIKFSYYKNGSTNTGLDSGFVKNIQINCDEYEKEIILPNEFTTNDQGQLNIEGIEWGDYYVQEIETPDGYELSDIKYHFTVDRETFKNDNRTVISVRNEDTDEMQSIITNNQKLGKVTLTKYACDSTGAETTNTLPNAVYELYKSNGELVGEYTTDVNGQIEVENLDWNSYYFLEKEAPTGYSTSDKKISFVINSRNVSFEQNLLAYDKMESGEITVNKVIPAETIYAAHGNSSFIFKIVGKDENDQIQVTLYRTVTFTEEDKANADINGNVTKTFKISELNPYKYEITEEENYRYELDDIIPVSANASEDNNVGKINLLDSGLNKGEITFSNNKQSNSKLSHNEVITNSTQSEYYLIGFEAIPKENEYAIGTALTKDDFTYILYYSGGQEAETGTLDNITFNNGESSYTQTVIGDDIATVEYTQGGRIYTSEVQIKWVLPSDYFTYKANSDGTINITGINANYSSPEVLYIPSEFNGKRVKQVGGTGAGNSNKLGNIANVKTIQIADGVTSIGDSVFYSCSNLTSVFLPDTFTNIGNSAFEGCRNLTNIDLGNTQITNIGYDAFRLCSSLTNINLPNTLTRISSNTFSSCISLTSINLPDALKSIASQAFSSCTSLTEIELPDTVISIGNSAFKNCNNITNINLGNTQITSVGDSAFYHCSSLTSIEIPEGVTSIENYAFYYCSSLTSIDLSNTQVTSIGDYAFQYCSSLTSIDLSNTQVTSIGNYAFYNCSSLTSIDLSNTQVTSIGNYAFYNCSSLTSIDLPDTVTSIGDYAFNGCSNLTNINVDSNNTNYCSVDGVLFNKDNTILIKYPEGKQDITSYVVPNTVTSIGNYAFYNCSSLTEIELPDTVISISSYAFKGCNNLTNINLGDTQVTSIGDHAFYNCSSLTSIDLPDTVTSIGNNAFYLCSSLTSIDLSNTQITSIGSSAFSYCSSLTSIDLPDTVTSIGNYAFYYCSSLTSIDLSNTQVTSIGDYAFYNCSSLTSIEIPEGVTSIGTNAFYQCSSLTSIYLPDTVTSIGNSAFRYCDRLTDVYYTGTQEQFNAITVGTNNTPFVNAQKHYNYVPNP